MYSVEYCAARNKDELPIFDIYNHMDETHRHDVEWKKPDTKESILWFHFSEVSRPVKLNSNERNPHRGSPGGNDGKGADGQFWSLK